MPNEDAVIDTSYAEPRGTIYHYFLSELIEDDANTLSLIKALKLSSAGDIVNIYLNSPGGNTWTMMQVVNSIRDCAGLVVTHADGQVASAASLIFFSGQQLVVADLSQVMLHSGEIHTGGKAGDFHLNSDSLKLMNHKLFHSIYEPFFTPEELDKVLAGQDMYLDAEQVRGRIQRAIDKEAGDDTNTDE